MSGRAEGAVVGCLLLDFQILWIFIERFHLESAMDFTKLSGRFEVLLWRDVFTIERNNMIERLRFINFIEG
jgi:predicted ATPase